MRVIIFFALLLIIALAQTTVCNCKCHDGTWFLPPQNRSCLDMPCMCSDNWVEREVCSTGGDSNGINSYNGTNTSADYGPPSKAGLGAGAIIGIILGEILLVICVAAITYYVTKRRFLLSKT